MGEDTGGLYPLGGTIEEEEKVIQTEKEQIFAAGQRYLSRPQ